MKNIITYYGYLTYYYISIKLNHLKYKISVHNLKMQEYDARMFALLTHHKVSQRYDEKYPYYYHLNMVTDFVLTFHDIVDYDINAIFGSLSHDMIEDCRLTYSDVVKKYGAVVANIVFVCTDMRGKNRMERHNSEYYKTLQENEIGSFVKICDMTANMTMGKINRNSLRKKYRKDYLKFKEFLYKEKFKPMFDYMENNLLKD